MGRIAAKSENFLDYVRKAFKKVGLETKISDDTLQGYLDKYMEEYGQKLNCFYQLRTLLAPVVESVILLDRVLYVLEQQATESVALYKLFEPATSPRCYALVATKL